MDKDEKKDLDIEQLSEKTGIEKEKLLEIVEGISDKFKPTNLDELPKELKDELDKRIREETQKSEEILKKQLYDTVNSLKEKNEALLKEIEEQKKEQQKKVAEAEKKKKDAARKEEGVDIEKEIEEIRREYQEKLSKAMKDIEEQFSETVGAQNKVVEDLEKKLKISNLEVAKKDLLMEYGDSIIDDMIPDVTENPDMSVEQLRESFERAKKAFEKFTEKVTSKSDKRSLGAVPTGEGHLSGTKDDFKETDVRNIGMDELAKLKKKLREKYPELA